VWVAPADQIMPEEEFGKLDYGNDGDAITLFGGRVRLEFEGKIGRLVRGRRKGKGTIETYQYHINSLILPRWENVVAEEMKPLAIRNWLFDLHDGDDYHWETCSKTAGIMSLVFDFVDHNELYFIRNPMDKVTIPASEEEHPEVKLLSPEEVLSLMARLSSPVNTAVLLVAVTGVRISECLGLRWRHVSGAKTKSSFSKCSDVERLLIAPRQSQQCSSPDVRGSSADADCDAAAESVWRR
jgi:site-specific recombinase XerD